MLVQLSTVMLENYSQNIEMISPLRKNLREKVILKKNVRHKIPGRGRVGSLVGWIW